jgi:hypothetical protein
MQTQWENPFAQFLNVAHSEFRKIQPEPEVLTDSGLLPRFVQMSEDRSFVFDIVDRIQALATAFDRLHELSELYVQFDSKRLEAIDAQRFSDPARVQCEVPHELDHGLDRCRLEAQALVAFAYYELSTLATLLRDWLAPSPGSRLEYLIGVRNKILAHPRRDGRVKNSRSALTIGPILHAHLVGAQGWIPLIRDWYIKELTTSGNKPDDEAGANANVALLRDRKKRVKDLTPEEILRLKAYIIPEPDPLESAREMATLLRSKFSPEITRVCTARVR